MIQAVIGEAMCPLIQLNAHTISAIVTTVGSRAASPFMNKRLKSCQNIDQSERTLPCKMATGTDPIPCCVLVKHIGRESTVQPSPSPRTMYVSGRPSSTPQASRVFVDPCDAR